MDYPNNTEETLESYSFDYYDFILGEFRERVYPRSYEWPLIIAYIIIFLLALLGNTLVCVAVLRNDHMRTVTNYYIVNLALADILVSLICLPATVIVDVTESWFFGNALCNFIPYFQNVSVAVSVYTLTMIAVDRYLAICRPLKFQISATRTVTMIVLVWLVSLVIMIPNAVYYGVDVNEKLTLLGKPRWLCKCGEIHWKDVAHQQVYYVFTVVATYLIPLAVIIAAYVKVCIRLWSGIPTEEGSKSSGSEMKTISKTTQAQLNSRRNVARMLIVVVVVFAVCYLPVHLLNLLRVFDVFKDVDPHSGGHKVLVPYLIAHLMAFINSAVNPVIYNFMSAKFRQAFISVFGCCSSVSRRTPPGHPNTRGYNRSFLHSTTAVSESRSHGTEYVAMSQTGKGAGSNTAWQST